MKVITRLCMPLIVIFTLPARKPAHNNLCVPFPYEGCTPLFWRKKLRVQIKQEEKHEWVVHDFKNAWVMITSILALKRVAATCSP